MGLKFSIPHRTVALPDGDEGETASITIRGLSPADIAAIMREDGGQVVGVLYTQIVANTATAETLAEIVLTLLGELPDLIAKIIARAADVPDEWELVGQVPLGAQYELIETIGAMTFTSENAKKKVLEIVARYLKAAEKPQPHLRTSTSGSGASESR